MTRSAGGVILGIGIGLTTATQLRPFEAIPVGPGELVLAVWSLVMLASLLIRGTIVVDSGLRVLAGFWAVAIAALASGWIVGLTGHRSDLSLVRDLLAFGLSAGVFLLVYTAPKSPVRLAAAEVAFMLTVLLPGLGFLLLTATGRLSLGPVTPWYYDIRFEGWSQNPNQMALAMLPIPFWALRRLQQGRGPAWLLRGCAVCSSGIGVLTRSDALWLAWSIAAVVASAAWLVRRLALGRWSRVAAVLVVVVLPLTLFAAAIGMGERLVDAGGRALAADYKERDQGPDRLRRWGHALQAIDDSPLVGWGPGSFSGPNHVYEGEEAHNTLLDFAASTGAVGLFALLGILVYASICAWERRDGSSLLLLLTVGIFLSFHYVARQPLFWLVLLGAMAGSSRDLTSPEARGQELS